MPYPKPTDDELPFLVWFTPQAIREYFDPELPWVWEDTPGLMEFVTSADEATLRLIGEVAINDERLWETFANVIFDAANYIKNTRD